MATDAERAARRQVIIDSAVKSSRPEEKPVVKAVLEEVFEIADSLRKLAGG